MTQAPLVFHGIVVSLLQLGFAATAMAQQQPSAKLMATTLKERQELMRLITQQQQSVLQQRFNCINRATNLADLERCERGYGFMGPGRAYGAHMGNDAWRCPMW